MGPLHEIPEEDSRKKEKGAQMTILDRHIAKEFLKYFIMVALSLVALYLIIDFFGKARMFLSNRATLTHMAAFVLFSIPHALWQFLPASVLISCLITFGSLSRTNEITALKACGINVYRAIMPVLIMAALICSLSFAISEFITPFANEKAKNIRFVEIEKRERLGTFTQNQTWYRGQRGIYNFKSLDRKSSRLRGITIYYLDKDLHLLKRIDAEQGIWEDGKWTFIDTITTTFPQDQFPELTIRSSKEADLPENPDKLTAVQKDAGNMGFLELRRYIEKLQSEGYDAAGYRVDLQGKIAFPLVNIIMALIGISFSLRRGRSGGRAQGFAAGVIIALCYWLLFSFTVSLGRAEILPPLVAGWTSNVVFLLLAFAYFRRLPT